MIKKNLNNKLHWTTEMSEKGLLAVIGALTMVAAGLDIYQMVVVDMKIELADLFLLFIYAEIIGMVGAYTSSSRIPVTLPIIIAITALCRLIVMHSKEMDALILLSESTSILVLGVAAYILSLKGKLSFEKERMVELANEERGS